MAITSQGFFYTVTLIDEELNETTREYALTSADYATAVADAAAIVTALLNVTDGVISRTQLAQRFVESALVPPSGDQPASAGVAVTTLIAGAGTKKADYNIPMPKDAIMSGNSLIVTNAQVIAYHALFQAGGEATISDGETAGAIQKGVRVTRARRFTV